MARSSRTSRPAARPAPAPQKQAPPPPAPVQAAPPQVYQQPQQPGMLASIAANAASIAIGSTIARGVSGALFGGNSAPQTVAEPQPQQQQQQYQQDACAPDQKAFTKCLETNNDINACQFYLDMLKQCQSAQKTY
ncbi:hypothetical protein EDD86DRAFT_245196 [Gorgonomyces haynaldii]|nr:hypothetical protein EDD86DRAFT_245196 [Gorgonomyces haynaldii]